MTAQVYRIIEDMMLPLVAWEASDDEPTTAGKDEEAPA